MGTYEYSYKSISALMQDIIVTGLLLIDIGSRVFVSIGMDGSRALNYWSFVFNVPIAYLRLSI